MAAEARRINMGILVTNRKLSSIHSESVPRGRLTHYQTTNFSFYQTDDNFKFGENGSKLSKRVENIVGIGEIARYEQLLLFPQCFQKACLPGCGNGLKPAHTAMPKISI